MADKYDIGPKITLQGEREFRNAISEINNGLKVNASALTLLTAKYADNANSVQALTEKGVVLESKITSQTDKVTKLREALANSATKYGEADKRTMAWQVSLNNADAELIKMQGELKRNNAQLEQAQKDMKKYGTAADEVADKTSGFGNKVGDLANALGINLPAGADKAIRSMDGTKASTLALVGVVTGIIAGFGKATIETAKYADEILALSEVTGLSTDVIQGMNFAAEFTEVSAETMTGSMRKMIRSMGDAKGGSKEAKEAFKDLHVSITNNGQLKNSEQMFYELVDALGRVKNETERDALSMKIFGRSAQDLNPLINAGSKALKEYTEQAKEMGYVLDNETLKAFEHFDTSMKLFNKQTDSFKNSIAIVLLPVLTGFFELLNKIDPKILATVAIVASIAVVAITVVKGITSITDTFKGLDTKALRTTAIVVGIVAALIALAAVIAVIIGKGSELDRTMANVGTSVGNMTSTVNGAGSQVRYSYASGIDYVPSDRVATIHKGERVQRADENPYNPAASNASGDMIILNVNMSEVDEVYKLVNVVKQAKQSKRAGRVVMA